METYGDDCIRMIGNEGDKTFIEFGNNGEISQISLYPIDALRVAISLELSALRKLHGYCLTVGVEYSRQDALRILREEHAKFDITKAEAVLAEIRGVAGREPYSSGT